MSSDGHNMLLAVTATIKMGDKMVRGTDVMDEILMHAERWRHNYPWDLDVKIVDGLNSIF